MLRPIYLFIFLLLISACSKEELPDDNPTPTDEGLYFPPYNGNQWETYTPEELGWNTSEIPALEQYLEINGTRAFIVLKKGKIVIEKYWNTDISNSQAFNQNSIWFWASAGKTLSAFLVGIAQEENLLNIEDKTSDYLGTGWTSMNLAQENQIKIKHQLMMTTGLDYNVPAIDCTDDTCLLYLNDPGTQWYYHNAPYTLLEQVVSQASGVSYNDFTDSRLQITGIDGNWVQLDYNNVFWSTARDAARFALLLLADGKWKETTVLGDINYLNQMRTPSQTLNPSYGYLTWLNGQSAIMLPTVTTQVPLSLSENAPSDLYAGMGKDGQFIEVIPSQELVVIRMGQAPDNSLVPIQFHNEMWEKINDVIN